MEQDQWVGDQELVEVWDEVVVVVVGVVGVLDFEDSSPSRIK
jgi:hypothetical protein